MSALMCDICGGDIVMNPTGEFAVCESCGMKHSKERVQAKIQEIKGTVTVEGTVKTKETDFVIRGGVLEKYNGEDTEVVIPNNVVAIGENAFAKCKGIINISIPLSVREIGAWAFSECESLKNITIPDSVTVLGYGAFWSCRRLQQVTLSKSIKLIQSETFACCNALVDISIPEGVTYIDNRAFRGCSNLQRITFPNSVKEVKFLPVDCEGGYSNDLFAGCTKLSDIKMPQQIEDEFIRLALRGWHDDTPYGINKVEDARAKLRNAGRCQFCGGDFKGIFNKVCTKCNRPKNY